MAKAMNKKEVYKEYTERAQNYKNVFDPETQFMRGRFRNTWFTPFDPYEVNFNYTEANAWQYSFYVPQDISGFTNLLGGKDKLEANLDKLFVAEYKTSGRHQVDITGLIGQYAHGNEPSHHMAYLYNFVNKPYKTQEKVHQILTQLYTNTPNGISGNEDCGQMSAWYIFSSIGFYPVTPGSNQYIIGTPLFNKATFNLESGKTFTVSAENLSDTNIYIASATLNEKPYNQSYISHENLMNGGTLHFKMKDSPTDWATKDNEIPETRIEDHIIITPPFISKGKTAFKGETRVELQSNTKDASIYYSENNSDFKIYKKPFTISEAETLKVYSQLNGIKSKTLTTNFFKIDPDLSIKLDSEYANQYNAGGNNALIDGILGTQDFRTGTWQGYFDTDLIATVDLGSSKSINMVKVNFLQDQRSWIFPPSEVSCLGSNDGINFSIIDSLIKIDNSTPSETVKINTTYFKQVSKKYRFIKVIAKKLGQLPKWHLGHKDNGRSWLFVDEIIIK